MSTPQNCNVRTNLCNEEDHASEFDSRNDQNDREYQKIEGRNIDLEEKRDRATQQTVCEQAVNKKSTIPVENLQEEFVRKETELEGSYCEQVQDFIRSMYKIEHLNQIDSAAKKTMNEGDESYDFNKEAYSKTCVVDAEADGVEVGVDDATKVRSLCRIIDLSLQKQSRWIDHNYHQCINQVSDHISELQALQNEVNNIEEITFVRILTEDTNENEAKSEVWKQNI